MGEQGRIPAPDMREGIFSIEGAYKEASRIGLNTAIDPKSLIGKHYNEQEVRADVQYANDKEGKLDADMSDHEREAIKLAKIVETVVDEQINAGWFGPNIKTTPASKFDDIDGKVDLVAEAKVESKSGTAHVALAIDVTYSHDLKRKIHLIQEEIVRNELATVKYYRSNSGKYVGSLRNIPRLVLGIDSSNAERLARVWFQKNPAIKNDPVREQLLIEAIDQCEAFEKFATKVGSQKAAASYRLLGLILQRAYGTPVTMNKRQSFSKDDKVFRQLQVMINSLDTPLQ